MQPCPKPEPRSKAKARAHAAERAVIEAVREAVFRRDPTCRMAGETYLGDCDGPHDWAHMAAKRRSKTRGLPPEERHSTTHSLRLCRRHHDAYDRGEVLIEPVTARGADSYLVFCSRLSNAIYLEVRGGIVSITTSHAQAAGALVARLLEENNDGEEGDRATLDRAR